MSRPDDRPAVYAVLRQLLFLVPAERIHGLVFAGLRGATAAGPVRRRLSRRLAPIDPILASTVFGVRFPGPLGLAAGFDKDGTATVSDWDGGALSKIPGDCKSGVSLQPDAKAAPDAVTALTADKEYSSDDADMRALKPRVSEILIGYQ